MFVDAYAGTGAVGIEALSRGARHAIFIEKDRAAANLIKSNLAALKAEARARVIHGPRRSYLGRTRGRHRFHRSALSEGARVSGRAWKRWRRSRRSW